MKDKLEPMIMTVAGGTSTGLGIWSLMQQVTTCLGFISALCGAIMGAWGVYRLFFGKKETRNEDPR